MSSLTTPSFNILYLMACALRGKRLDPAQASALQLDDVYELTQSSGVSALCACAFSQQSGEWKDAYYTSLRRAMLFKREREALLAELDSAGIWSALLKGSYVAELYPALGMREMVDNDILVDQAHIDDVASIMQKRGYERISGYGIGVDDEYHKEPVFNFEMHRYLFAKDRVPLLGEYFANFPEMFEEDPNNSLRRIMKPNYLYLYVIAHAWRHYSQRGTGLRILSDVCVLLLNYKNELDWELIERDAQALGIAEFEATTRSIATKMLDDNLSPAVFSEDECELIMRLSADGFYGSYENRVERLLDEANKKGWSRARYLASRIFPSADWYKTHYPFASKHVWARPIALVRFWAYVLATPYERAKIPVELKALFKKD